MSRFLSPIHRSLMPTSGDNHSTWLGSAAAEGRFLGRKGDPQEGRGFLLPLLPSDIIVISLPASSTSHGSNAQERPSMEKDGNTSIPSWLAHGHRLVLSQAGISPNSQAKTHIPQLGPADGIKSLDSWQFSTYHWLHLCNDSSSFKLIAKRFSLIRAVLKHPWVCRSKEMHSLHAQRQSYNTDSRVKS